MARRIRWFGLAMIVLFCALLLQLDNIQGIKANQYQHAGNNPVTLEDAYAKPRGTIESADGVTLATSVPDASSLYYKYERVYPTGPLFSQVVGFTSYRYAPSARYPAVTGVEYQYNDQLTFHTEPVRTLGDLLTTEQGTDTVVLTLEDKLQALARTALGNLDGAVVVLDPSNGDVLAMYSNPSFNPTPIASPSPDSEAAGFHAWEAFDPTVHADVGTPMAYEEGFHPGSTFKVITSAAAFDHDPKLTTQSFPYVSSIIPPGAGNTALHNDDGPCGGPFQGPDMLPKSCDTGFATVGLDLGAQNLVSEASSFGFWARPPIDLPTSPASVSQMCTDVAATETGCEIALSGDQPFLAYSAIGQGNVSASPLEMAMVASAIANDGVIMKPHVMARIIDPKDNVIQTYQPTPWLKATTAQTAASVSKMMQAVVSNPVGTAYPVGFPAAWDVAAKTGTAQDLGDTATTDWMIAFAPANNPQVAIAVVVPDQAKSASGASVSGPIVKTVLNGIFGGAS
jgi:peptidoglycan glycosyltransferase